MDETYVGGTAAGVGGRQLARKCLVVVAVELDGEAVGRIRLHHLTEATGDSLGGFVRDSVGPGSTMHTDGWKGYATLERAGYAHRVSVTHGGQARNRGCRQASSQSVTAMASLDESALQRLVQVCFDHTTPVTNRRGRHRARLGRPRSHPRMAGLISSISSSVVTGTALPRTQPTTHQQWPHARLASYALCWTGRGDS